MSVWMDRIETAFLIVMGVTALLVAAVLFVPGVFEWVMGR
jgi:hypothetical protein